MKTIGELFKEARLAKNVSLTAIENETKIKAQFVVSIESNDWAKLPEYPVTLGFVKTLADYLGLSQNKAVAFLRRDYPPKVLSINPKPDISRKFSWNPKITFTIGIIIAVLILAGYLIIQYLNFIRPPFLEIITPKSNEEIRVNTLLVSGKTVSDATVTVNNQPAIVEDTGNFSTQINVLEETKELVIVARSRSGKETTVKRPILVRPD